MVHATGESRYQRVMMAASLDEIVDAEHPVRVIDAFVDGLDLKARSSLRLKRKTLEGRAIIQAIF